ncbi:MAG: ABC transporter permease subunit [Thermomicrobiales bacterium]
MDRTPVAEIPLDRIDDPAPPMIVAEPTHRLAAKLRTLGDGLFVIPALAGIVLVLLIPTITALVRSFTDWQPAAAVSWVGFANYEALFADSTFHGVLQNSLIYLIGVPFAVIIPLMIALMLYERTPNATFFRTIYLFPLVFSTAILGLLFQSILNPDGLLNSVLRSIGLDGLAAKWLDDPALVKFTIMGVSLWGGLGMSVLIFHAALSAIPPELFEAAELDGAGWWRKLRYVMIPGIRPVLEGMIVVSTVGIFIGYFGLIKVLTNGGPNNASAAMDFDLYTRAFSLFDYAGSAAEAVVLLILVAAVVGVLVLLRAFVHRSRPLPSYPRTPFSDRVRSVPAVQATRRWTGDVLRRIRMKLPNLPWSPVRLIIAIAILIMFIYPMVYLAGTAVRTRQDFNANPEGLPTTFTLDFIVQAWTQANMGLAMINSFVSVGIAVFVCATLSTLSAFWLIRHTGKLRIVILAFIGLFYFVPGAVWVIPLNTLLVQVGLADNIVTLGIIQGIAQLPFGIVLMTTYLMTGLPLEILESARIDGASLWQQFIRIVIPLAGPGLGALIALVTAFTWGDLQLGLVLMQTPDNFPVTLAVTQLVGKSTPGLQPIAAAGLISLLPLLVLFAFTQRFMVRGISSGIGRV